MKIRNLKTRLIGLGFLILLFQPVFSLNARQIVWNKTPINVVLPVGKERLIMFSSPVQFGYDDEILSSDKLRVQNVNGTLYLLAKQIFDSQRVEVKSIDTGKIILLNLSSKTSASDIPLNIKTENPDELDSSQWTKSKITTPSSLIKFAAHQLYAPKRLIPHSTNIYRVSMQTTRTIPLLLDGSLIAMPQASWHGGNFYVTAVLLRNMTSLPMVVNPKTFCGDWNMVGIYPRMHLKKKGSTQDSTTVFLVSRHSFIKSTHICNGETS